MPNQPTPYAAVNVVLGDLLAGVRRILGEQFVGMYLYGSLSSGEFDPSHSDIDFVVVTASEVSDRQFRDLDAMHQRLAAHYPKWGPKLEGAYIPVHSIRRADPADTPHPFLNEGIFRFEQLGIDWIIQRYVIREYGVVLAGPPPSTLIDPVLPDHLRWAVWGALHGWWAAHLSEPLRLNERGYQAFAITTMCRALYTLETGDLCSKRAAIQWAQETIGDRWGDLIERAIEWQNGLDDPADGIEEAQEFIRYTIERSEQIMSAADES